MNIKQMGRFLKNPTNHKDLIGQPMLFAVMPVARIVGGEATIQYNLMTSDWFVDGQRDRATPYVMSSFRTAIALAQTINHFNATGEKKVFKGAGEVDMEIVEETPPA